jgi:predicted enzyme related to lactoylglutathione lyase
MLQGLRTVIYAAPDLAAGKEWYTRVLGFPPYFDQPFYVGFNVGGYELGLDPHAEPTGEGKGGLAYWGVPDAAIALEQLSAAGASIQGALQDVGDGIRVASVRDPFGNILGVIENPHFKLPA